MKTREERTERTAGRSFNGPPGSAAGVGPSPFLSRPSSPLGSKANRPTDDSRDREVERPSSSDSAAVAAGHVQQLSRRSDQDDEPMAASDTAPTVDRSRNRTSSTGGDASSGGNYPPSRSVSAVRPLTGGSPSFMMGSWAGYSSKAGIVGLGSHSLMQMINAIGLDAAREEEEDAVEGTTPGQDDHLPVSPKDASQGSQQGGSQHSSDEESDTDKRMRATVAHDYRARRRGKRPWMSSSIDAIHTRMPGRRVWPNRSKLPVLQESVQKMKASPRMSPVGDGGLSLPGKGALAAEGEALRDTQEAESPRASTGSVMDTHDIDPPKELLQEGTNIPATSSSGSPQILQGDLSAEPYDTLDDEESRRAILAQKLQEVFNLPTAETVLAEYPSWLFRSVLLQGFLYLTEKHLCFYAYIKGKEGQVIRSGTMYRRFPKSILQSKYWFILKDDVLSWYSSSTNPYFPVDHIPLHYVTSIEPSPTHEDRFKIITPSKVYRFAAESAKSQQEWIKILRKVAFRSQSVEDSIKLVIPLSTIAKVDVAENLEFAKATMRVEAMEHQIDGSITPDEYYFSFAGNPHEIVEAVEHSASRARQLALEADRSQSNTPQDLSRTARPRHGDTDIRENAGETLTQLQESSDTSFDEDSSPLDPNNHSAFLDRYTYPPSLSGLPEPRSVRQSSDGAWTTWIRKQPRKVFGVPAKLPFAGRLPFTYWGHSGKHEGSAPFHDGGGTSSDDEADMVEELDLTSKEKRFLKTTFGLGEREEVVYQQRCYISRGVPVYGTLYVTTSYLCFKSQSILTKTKMILPLHEVIAVQKAKPLRFDYSGLVLVVRGHEELFFEIGSTRKRDDLLAVIVHQLYTVVELDTKIASATDPKQELQDLEALHKLPPSPSGHSDMSPIMFSSTTSSFVTFQPPQPLHITCLTVGSRGDVQPYIALCCGLMKEGHRCRIASHPEYQSWVESYGIEFRAVGGDPAELMRICVENGMFTVSFLREGVAKFRGWLDDLLVSSWEACQGTDLLIESPSTMAGVHIAEALQIPFFRAFTMPWTRTRAYPHAFAVPETKMGGGYNYMTYTIFDQVFWLAISGQVNRWRKSLLQLHATTAEKLELHKVPFLYNFSPTVVPPPMDWMEYIHVTGYWHLDNADVSGKKWEPPEELLEFMERARAAGKKLVYIGFGSIVVSDPAALTSMILGAVEEAGVWAIISKGWSDRIASNHDTSEAKAAKLEKDTADLGALPENVYNISSIPHDWLFPRVDAVCHHGGAGTTGASLRAGRPTIIKPFFGDQAFWAERVETLRVGIALRKMTVASLAHALVSCTEDQILVESAKRLGLHIREENGVATAIEAIYRDLDYAKSLIKQDVRLSHKQRIIASSSGSPGGPRPEGALSDGSSGWDILSERTSSAHAMSEDEIENVSRDLPSHQTSSDEHGSAIPKSPLRISTSNSIKRTLSRANSILPASLLARRRHSHAKESEDRIHDSRHPRDTEHL